MRKTRRILIAMIPCSLFLVSSPNAYSAKTVLLVVDSAIESHIDAKLEQFRIDLEIDGYQCVRHNLLEETPEELRARLYHLYQNTTPPITGAILIGKIPKAYHRVSHPAGL